MSLIALRLSASGTAGYRTGNGLVQAKAAFDYLAADVPGHQLAVLVKHHVTTVGKTSLDTFITMERADEPAVIWAEGGARMVWLDFATNQSLPLPAWLRDRIVGLTRPTT